MKMSDNRKIKVCFAASTGGHFEQIMMLKPLMEKYGSFLITEETNYRVDTNDMKIYYLKQTNRKEGLFLINFIINVIKSIKIYIKEKPDVVITTGVLSMIPISIIAKICRKKLIYIESFAIVNKPTLTGRLLYKFADRFYVQWESMLKVYKKAIFLGGLY